MSNKSLLINVFIILMNRHILILQASIKDHLSLFDHRLINFNRLKKTKRLVISSTIHKL